MHAPRLDYDGLLHDGHDEVTNTGTPEVAIEIAPKAVRDVEAAVASGTAAGLNNKKPPGMASQVAHRRQVGWHTLITGSWLTLPVYSADREQWEGRGSKASPEGSFRRDWGQPSAPSQYPSRAGQFSHLDPLRDSKADTRSLHCNLKRVVHERKRSRLAELLYRLSRDGRRALGVALLA